MRSMLRLAAAAALVFSIGTAQAENQPTPPFKYAGGADLISPNQTVWTNGGITIVRATYPDCVTALQEDIAYRISQGYQLHELYPCHLVRPAFGTSTANSADHVLSPAAIDNLINGTTVLRERFRIDLYEAETKKLLQQQQR